MVAAMCSEVVDPVPDLARKIYEGEGGAGSASDHQKGL